MGQLKTIAAVVLAGTTLMPTQTTAQSQFDGLVLSEHFYYRLARCETGSAWNHEQPSYTSAFGIARGVWERYSNSTRASRYTPRQQAVVVDRIAFHGHTVNGKHWRPVGPWGWTVVRNNCMNLQSFICKSRKPVVQRWKRNCQQ